MKSWIYAFGLTLGLCNMGLAGEADVIDVKVSGNGPEYRFSVTVEHADTGWDHYADGWEAVSYTHLTLPTKA